MVVPFWFKQRQGKAEPAGSDMYRLTAPNLGEVWIGIRRGPEGHWLGFLKQAADGPEMASTPPLYDDPEDAWGAAFESYRVHVVT